jgi:hypothetical protein
MSETIGKVLNQAVDVTAEYGKLENQCFVATDVVARREIWQGNPTIAVTVTAPVPLLGFFGPPHTLRVMGRALVETLGGSR